MNKKLIIVSVLILTIVLALIFISPYFRSDRFGDIEIEWVDFIKVDGKMYHVEYDLIDNESVKVNVDANDIGEEIGSVKFNLSKNVHSDDYEIKDWDASYLEVGTKVYLLLDEKYKNSVVVDINGVYYLYSILPH